MNTTTNLYVVRDSELPDEVFDFLIANSDGMLIRNSLPRLNHIAALKDLSFYHVATVSRVDGSVVPVTPPRLVSLDSYKFPVRHGDNEAVGKEPSEVKQTFAKTISEVLDNGN